MPPVLVFALRVLRRTPGLNSVAVLCLAVAIGLSTAAFTVIHGAFLSPLPAPAAERLVMVHDYHRAGRYNVPMSSAQLTLRRESCKSFDDLAAWYSRNVTIATTGEKTGSESIARAAYVSPNALQLLGINPRLGRLPAEDDAAPGRSPVVVLGGDLWRARFGGDEAILGRPVQIAGTPHVVIGVMPPGVRFPVREDLWIPVQMNSRAPNATGERLTLFGRLAPGVTSRQAETELAAMAAAERVHDQSDAVVPVVMPFTRGYMSPEQELAIYGFMFGLVAFLVVTAANLANLFLARNAARVREIAFSVSPAVLSFVMVAALIASVVAGVVPALRMTRGSTFDALKSGGSASSSFRFSRTGAALLATQLAVGVGFLSVVGVLAQALFGFSYQRFQIAGDQVLIAQVYMGAPPQSELSRPGAVRRDVWQRHFERSRQQFERIVARLLEQPGVRRATFATHFPGNDVETVRIEVESASGAVLTRIAEIGPDFFDALDTRTVLLNRHES